MRPTLKAKAKNADSAWIQRCLAAYRIGSTEKMFIK